MAGVCACVNHRKLCLQSPVLATQDSLLWPPFQWMSPDLTDTAASPHFPEIRGLMTGGAPGVLGPPQALFRPSCGFKRRPGQQDP